MARRNEAGGYLLDGKTPVEIAQRMGITLGTVRQYLCTLVGEGELLAADVALSIPEGRAIEEAIRKGNLKAPIGRYAQMLFAKSVRKALQQQGAHLEQLDLIELYLTTRDIRPDLYSLVCEIEVLLHRFVRRVLEAAFQDKWWHNGIPQQIRQSCQIRREEDEIPLRVGPKSS